MSFLTKITHGKIKKPYLVLIHGQPGVGKTTFSADFPQPIFLCTENGTNFLDVSRLPKPETFDEVLSMLQELIELDHDYKTLVIDSLDHLEPMVHQLVCKQADVETIEKAFGGFGKGYVAALDHWKKLIHLIHTLQAKRSMNVVFIAHSLLKEQYDPREGKSYPRFMIKLNEKASSLFRETVDCILFAAHEVFIRSENGKNRAIGQGNRVIYTEWRPSHDGKNRYGLPYQLPLSFTEFDQASQAGNPEDPEKLKSHIQELLGAVSDETLKKTVQEHVEKASSATQLMKILNRLEVKLASK